MSERQTLGEPHIQPTPLGPEKRFNDGLERAASFLTSGVATLLVLFVVIALCGVVMGAWRTLVHDHDPMRAAVTGLDAAFVVVILLELVHTTLSRGPISTQVQEFLVIGITSAIRNGLETAAGRNGNPRDTAIDLAITSFAAVLLVVALWLVRQRLDVERRSRESASHSRNNAANRRTSSERESSP